MPYVFSDGDPSESVLQMEHIVFDELSFVREGFENEDDDSKVELNIGVAIQQNEDAVHHVTLQVTAHKHDEYTAKVKISGFFKLKNSEEVSEELIKKNVVAILFPYVRSELSLITAQPETDPIVLPAFNVSAMLDSANKSQDQNE